MYILIGEQKVDKNPENPRGISNSFICVFTRHFTWLQEFQCEMSYIH